MSQIRKGKIVKIFKLIHFFNRYLKHILLPITKYSFYAGNTTFSVAQNIFNVYDRCKELLDTNGNSWNDPITDFSQFNVKVIPIVIPNVPDDEAMKACASLLINQNDDETEEDMLISLPKIETEDNNDLSLIRFPLKRKHSYSINSRKASFILVRYFVMVTQCFKYQGINQSLFNKKLNLWLNENVIPYLDDDQLYPAFGAVLRVIEAIKNPHDGTYQGAKKVYIKSRMSQMARKTSILGDALGSENNFYLNDGNRDFNWWLNVNLASTGIFIFFCLIIFMMVRICCNRKRIIETEYNTRINTTNNGTRKTKPMTSLKSKMSKIFRNSTHIPENDEFYEYKRVNSNDKKEIKFENEKFKGALSPTPSKKKKNVKVKLIEKFNLPLLNAESEEDEIVFQKTRDSTDRSSVSLNNELFKISEESGNESSGSKASKRHRKKQSKSPKGQNGKK